MTVPSCPLCATRGGVLLTDDGRCRVVLVEGDEAGAFPGYCRVIWHSHVREMSDLTVADQRHVLDVVLALERAIRKVMVPDKINLAALGNMTPHLHWHVIPRWQDDSHFPDAIWASARREVPMRPRPQVSVLQSALRAELLRGEKG